MGWLRDSGVAGGEGKGLPGVGLLQRAQGQETQGGERGAEAECALLGCLGSQLHLHEGEVHLHTSLSMI